MPVKAGEGTTPRPSVALPVFPPSRCAPAVADKGWSSASADPQPSHPSFCPQWDEGAILEAKADLMRQLADPHRRLIGEEQVADVRADVAASGASQGGREAAGRERVALAARQPQRLQRQQPDPTSLPGPSPPAAFACSGGGAALAGTAEPDRVFHHPGTQAARDGAPAAAAAGVGVQVRVHAPRAASACLLRAAVCLPASPACTARCLHARTVALPPSVSSRSHATPCHPRHQLGPFQLLGSMRLVPQRLHVGDL